MSDRIACQGIKGAYSQIAAEKLFPDGKIIFFRTFDAAAEAVKNGMCRFGVLPIENNTYGSVRAVYDILKKGDVQIVRGMRLCIRHELLVKPGVSLTDVREIYSHEQAIGQCAHFLKDLGEKVKVVPCLNTAVAARYVSENERTDIAAIASPEAGELYGLKGLDVKIQDSDNNYTRFICIAKEPAVYPGANRISLILSVPHRPGALYEVLGEFAALKINILKLESSPIAGRNFEFLFYIDLEASVTDPQVQEMLKKLKAECPDFIYLGNYSES
jgi:chorismate mutase/prephenate dehydratase